MSNPMLKRKLQLELKKKMAGLSPEQKRNLIKYASAVVEASSVPQPKLDTAKNTNSEIQEGVIAPKGKTVEKADLDPNQTKLDIKANPNVEIKPEVVDGDPASKDVAVEKAASLLAPFEGNPQFEAILASRVASKYYQKYANDIKSVLAKDTSVPQPKLNTEEANVDIKPKTIAPDGVDAEDVDADPSQTKLDTSDANIEISKAAKLVAALYR